jgi:hypothetical protein
MSWRPTAADRLDLRVSCEHWCRTLYQGLYDTHPSFGRFNGFTWGSSPLPSTMPLMAALWLCSTWLNFNADATAPGIHQNHRSLRPLVGWSKESVVKMRVERFTTTLTTLEALHFCHSQTDTYADGNRININSLPPLSGLAKHKHFQRSQHATLGPSTQSFAELYITQNQQPQ